MKKLSMIIVLTVLVGGSAYAQDKAAIKYASTITAQDMRSKLTILASDEMEGRETGEKGQKMAAEFLSKFYADLGMTAPSEGTYYQKFDLYQTDWTGVTLKTKNGQQKNGDTFVFRGNGDMKREAKIFTVFAGAGSEADFEGIDLTDKGVIIIPEGNNSNDAVIRAKAANAKAIFIGSGTNEEFAKRLPRLSRSALKTRLRLTENRDADENLTFYISNEMAADLLNTTAEKLTAAMSDSKSIKGRTVRTFVKRTINAVATENMVAFIEGTDLKDEVLVLSSHFDHIGQNADGTVINNGADDDGSGTTAVMELAEAFKQAANEGNGPRRSILFLNVTGEEKGLLGSDYYGSHPLFPLENTVNNLNIDMIGRVDPDHEDNPNYVYAIGSEKLSSHLKIISEYANITYTNIDLDYRYDDPEDKNRFYYRSDHYNFAKHGIPIIFYFNGTHADYHRPSDTVDKIEFDLMANRTRLIFHTAWLLANRDERTPVDKEDDMTYNR
jgi:hypothetical protein